MTKIHTTHQTQHGQRRNKRRDRWNKPTTARPTPHLAIVEHIAMSRLSTGVVVWAHVPFAESDGEKTRPAVVVGRHGRNIELLPISTSPARFRFNGTHHELTDLDSAGLDRASGVRMASVTVDRIEVIQVVGELGPDDRAAIFGASLFASAI